MEGETESGREIGREKEVKEGVGNGGDGREDHHNFDNVELRSGRER